MKVISIEPTPSPNAMKLNMDEKLAPGLRYSFTAGDCGGAPDYLRRLLAIEGMKGIYQAADFISVERENGADWRAILAQVKEAFEERGSAADSAETRSGSASAPASAPPGSYSAAATSAALQSAAEGYGEAHVFVQMFRGIPMQVRVRTELEESRVALPDRFSAAAMAAAGPTPNLIKERHLADHGVRYGELADIAAQVSAELDAAYDDARLEELVRLALEKGASAGTPEAAASAARLSPQEIEQRLESPDWKTRYAALERLQPAPEQLPIIIKALADGNFSVRRLAVVYLGDIKGPEAVKLLSQALRDPSAAVRRTAGDALSDIGDPSAEPAIIEALRDPSKIVRWRAARFLYDCGSEAALSALQVASGDPEFEVALQARMAAERIASGEEAAGTVWQQMARSREK